MEDARGEFPWRKIMTGRSIDVGAGPDCLPLPDCQPFDQEHGDANKLSSYFKPGEFDYVHSSHCIEHMNDTEAALRDWLKAVKRGGHLIATCPDLGLYENFTYPSIYNPDHRSSYSFLYESSPFPKHVHFPTFWPKIADVAEVKLARLVVRNFDWKLGRDVDQTWLEEKGCELWNEFVLRKL